MSILDFKPFYVHDNRDRFKDDKGDLKRLPRGFTAFIRPSGKKGTVLVQAILCAYKDDFNKKIGRELAQKQEFVEVHARDLPSFLADLSELCCNWHSYKYVWKNLF